MTLNSSVPLSFLNNLPFGVFRLSYDGEITEINKAMAELLELNSFEEAISDLNSNGQVEVLSSYDWHGVLIRFQDGEEKVILEKKSIKTFKGRLIYVNVTCFCQKDSISGNEQYWGVVEDVSEIVGIRDKLVYRDDFLSSVINSLPFEFWVFDEKRRVLAQSLYSRNKWGNYEGKSVKDFPLKFGVEESRELFYDRVLEGESFDRIEKIESAGKTKFIHSILAPLRQNKTITGVISILIDETEKMMARERVREIHDFLETILNAIPVRVFWKNTDLQFVGGNDSFLKDVGFETEEELHGKTDYDLLTEEDADFYQGLYQEVLRTKKSFLNIKMWLQIPNNEERYILASVIPYFSASGSIEGVLGCYQDITRMKNLENELLLHRENLEQMVEDRTTEIHQLNEELISSNEELHTLNELLVSQKRELVQTVEQLRIAQGQLIKSEKMASLGVLTAGIAHEMNNPLNFISSGMHGLEQIMKEIHGLVFKANDGETSPSDEDNKAMESLLSDLDELMTSIENGVNRTTNIVKGLRVFSRMDEEVKSMTDIHEIIDSALVILKNEYKDRIIIHRKFNKVPLVMCFPGKLSQVMVNLIMNGIQAIPEKGNIVIETRFLESEKKVCIAVIDDGCGIPDELKPKVFDPFFTTKPVNKGTGMGLALVYSMIKDHGGEITFESKEGAGTGFKIFLPQ